MATRSGVMLGIPDEKISFEDDINNELNRNKFGGVPNWITKRPEVYPQCNLCCSQLPMVAQIYCPLENSCYHRVLYLFGCVNSSCWNKNESWKVLRCQSIVKDDDCKVKKQETKIGDSWCDGADDWGDEETFGETNADDELQEIEKQTENLKICDVEWPDSKEFSETSNHTNKMTSRGYSPGYVKDTEVQSNMIHFVPYYITVIDESQLVYEESELTWSEKKLLNDYKKREGLKDIEEMMDVSAAVTDWSGEKYETSQAKHGDKIFQKFKKQLRLCPNQCLRYSWNGEPLLMTSQSLGTIPSCSSCGKKRIFELQLMPALVLLLKIDSEGNKTNTTPSDGGDIHIFTSHTNLNNLKSDSIEFGTVFIYTCSQECWSEEALYREEYVIVHSDPDQHLFKNTK